MLSAILFPLALGLFLFFTVGFWSAGEVLDPPRLIAAAISGLATMVFGRWLFRSLKQGLSAVPSIPYQTRRITFAVVMSATTIALAAFTTFVALDTSNRAKPGGFDNYILREQTRELEKCEQQLREWNNSPTDSRSRYAPFSEREISDRRAQVQRIRNRVEGAEFRQFGVIAFNSVFVLLGGLVSFRVIRGGGMVPRTALLIPLIIAVLGCLVTAGTVFSRNQTATGNQSQPQIQSTRSQ